MNNIISHGSVSKSTDYRAHTHTTRNTDTIKNTHVRKLTSIALMAIMVGGGLTFAIPGMEPAYAAQISSNPNLKVSAEGQNAGNEIASTNIIEIIVSDGDVNASDDEVLVTVDGDPITMTFFSGAWYAYIADTDIVDAGLTESAVSTSGEIDGLVMGEPEFEPARSPLVQMIPLDDGTFDIVYEKPANAQTVTLDLDDPDSGISLDRANYPQNTDVVATIQDQALNVDPTSADEWWFNTDGDPVYGTNANAANIATHAAAELARDAAYDAADAKRDNAVNNAAAIRDKAIADALADLNAVKAAIADLPSLLTYENQESEQTRRDNVIGAAQTAYEVIAGDPEAAEDSDDRKGAAQVAYELSNAGVLVGGSPEFVRAAERVTALGTYTDGTTTALPGATDGVADYFEPFSVRTSGVLECTPGADCAVLAGNMWVKFVEDDSNESTFSNTDDDDNASLRTTADAARGLSFEFEYDNGIEGGIGFSTTTITIDTDGDWGSGEEVSITLTDPDANTNSLSANDLDASNPDHIIPTIKIGDPFTLAAGDPDTVTLTVPDDDDTATDETSTVSAELRAVSDILVVTLPALTGDGEYTLDIDTGDWDANMAPYFAQDTSIFMGVNYIQYDLSALHDTAYPHINIEGYTVPQLVYPDGTPDERADT